MSRYLIAVLPFAIAALAPFVAALTPAIAPVPALVSPEPDPGFLKAVKSRIPPDSGLGFFLS